MHGWMSRNEQLREWDEKGNDGGGRLSPARGCLPLCVTFLLFSFFSVRFLLGAGFRRARHTGWDGKGWVAAGELCSFCRHPESTSFLLFSNRMYVGRQAGRQAGGSSWNFPPPLLPSRAKPLR